MKQENYNYWYKVVQSTGNPERGLYIIQLKVNEFIKSKQSSCFNRLTLICGKQIWADQCFKTLSEAKEFLKDQIGERVSSAKRTIISETQHIQDLQDLILELEDKIKYDTFGLFKTYSDTLRAIPEDYPIR